MRNPLTVLLAIVLALAGVPHALCACGCAGGDRSEGGGEPKATAGCPHCCGQAPEEESDGSSRPLAPEPCKCGACDQRAALAASPVLVDGAATRGIGHVPADFDAWLPLLVAPPRHSATASPAAPSLALPVRALPILLGRLLF